MLFNSIAFAIFLAIVFALYWVLPNKFRWALLLIASYYFYMSWSLEYVSIILTTTILSYIAALLIEKYEQKKVRTAILTIISGICIGILFAFKYFDFISDSIAKVLSAFTIEISPITLNLILPVGISFYTFKILSYVMDVYNGKVKAEHHFGHYATFISFFPDLLAGPIDRSETLLPQIKGEHKFKYSQATSGLKLMVWGYFKKLVIADSLLRYVNVVYGTPQKYSGFVLVLATLFFTIQIYCDFSGYSDIAIGMAKLMGIDLTVNFKCPYFSQSIKEFWSRWHISLSTWFRDYVYIPLGGNRVSKLRQCFNVMVTFLVSGLWHGANWTFIIWGGLHGAAQIVENTVIGRAELDKKAVLKWFRVLIVLIFVSFAWIFFASNSLNDAFYIIGHSFNGISNPVKYLRDGFSAIGIGRTMVLHELIMIGILTTYESYSVNSKVPTSINGAKTIIKWLFYVGIGLITVFFSSKGVASEFVYMQF